MPTTGNAVQLPSTTVSASVSSSQPAPAICIRRRRWRGTSPALAAELSSSEPGTNNKVQTSASQNAPTPTTRRAQAAVSSWWRTRAMATARAPPTRTSSPRRRTSFTDPSARCTVVTRQMVR